MDLPKLANYGFKMTSGHQTNPEPTKKSLVRQCMDLKVQ